MSAFLQDKAILQLQRVADARQNGTFAV